MGKRSFGPWLVRLSNSEAALIGGDERIATNIRDSFIDELRLHGWKAHQFPTPRSMAANLAWADDEFLSAFARLAHAWGGVAGLDDPAEPPLPGRHHATDPDLSPVTDDELAWATDAVAKARVIEPRICPNGLSWVYPNRRDEFAGDDFTQIALCRRWLSLVRPSGHYFEEEGSYQLKHVVEEWQEQYISNGCFLVAALAMGFKHRPDEKGIGRLNADLGLNASDVQSLLWRMDRHHRRSRSCAHHWPTPRNRARYRRLQQRGALA